MSIHFIGGKPGGGKTLYAVRLIIGEIVHGGRPILTNVPLNMGELNDYVQKEYPKTQTDVIGRIHLLSEQETKRFWTIRPGWKGYNELSKQDWQEGKTPDYSGVADKGVVYVIDEVHNFFGTRQWAETGRDAVFYLSQHRHLNDTVIAVTQATRNVDRMFRSVAQDFTHVRNMSKEKYGMFRLPAVFLRKTYATEPNPSSQAMEVKTFTLDVSGIAKCYDTAAGVGIHSKLADQGEKKSGLPYWAGLAMLALFLCLIFLGAPKLVASMFNTNSTKLVPPQVAPTTSQTAQPAPPPTQKPYQPIQHQPPTIDTNRLHVTGFMLYGKVALISLSDGRVVRSDGPHVGYYDKNVAFIDGKPLELP